MAMSTRKALNLLQLWHTGQWCPMYAAQSSGLVKSWTDLYGAIDRTVTGDARQMLLLWVQAAAKRSGGKFKHPSDGKFYYSVK